MDRARAAGTPLPETLCNQHVRARFNDAAAMTQTHGANFSGPVPTLSHRSALIFARSSFTLALADLPPSTRPFARRADSTAAGNFENQGVFLISGTFFYCSTLKFYAVSRDLPSNVVLSKFRLLGVNSREVPGLRSISS